MKDYKTIRAESNTIRAEINGFYNKKKNLNEIKRLENLTLLTGNGIDAGILDSPDFLLELKNLKSLEIYDGALSQDFLSMFLDNCPNCDLQIFKTP